MVQRMEGLVSRSVMDTQSISKSLRQELTQLYDNLDKEGVKFKLLKTEKEQSKRLLFLFQKDLSPGITGEILESKEQRENVVLQPVSQKVKYLAWFYLGVLDLGMLFYVFLFALSQDSHRQAAWGRSLGIYLFLDIVLISTLMVIFMHVLLPSLIMRDVGKIKKKVTESIKEFYVKMDQELEKKEKEKQLRGKKKKYHSDSQDDDDDDGKEGSYDDSDYDPLHLTKRSTSRSNHSNMNDSKMKIRNTQETAEDTDRKRRIVFNAVKYLFLSYRMAEQYPDLQASQIILQYSSPWPKQDYKHIKDVKSNYSDKYSGITRAISIIVIFFVTNLLATPLAIQDMILQICTTAAIGYTILIHIQLYYIYPALVIIPTLAVISLVFIVKHYYQKKRNEDDVKVEAEKNNLIKEKKTTPPASGLFTTPAVTTRRQSLQLGVQLAARLKEKIHEESEDSEEEVEEEEKDDEDLGNRFQKDEEEMDYKFSDDDRDSQNRRTEGASEENSESLHFRFSDEEQDEERIEEGELNEDDRYDDDYDYDFSYPHQRQDDISIRQNEWNGRNFDNAPDEGNSMSITDSHRDYYDQNYQNHSNYDFTTPSQPNNEHQNEYYPYSQFVNSYQPSVAGAAPSLSYFPNYYYSPSVEYDNINNIHIGSSMSYDHREEQNGRSNDNGTTVSNNVKTE
jgi:Sec-independent protein translocase protein TatA